MRLQYSVIEIILYFSSAYAVLNSLKPYQCVILTAKLALWKINSLMVRNYVLALANEGNDGALLQPKHSIRAGNSPLESLANWDSTSTLAPLQLKCEIVEGAFYLQSISLCSHCCVSILLLSNFTVVNPVYQSLPCEVILSLLFKKKSGKNLESACVSSARYQPQS